MSWKKKVEHTEADLRSHTDILNPNNDAYWKSRGYDGRPENWKEIMKNDTGSRA